MRELAAYALLTGGALLTAAVLAAEAWWPVHRAPAVVSRDREQDDRDELELELEDQWEEGGL